MSQSNLFYRRSAFAGMLLSIALFISGCCKEEVPALSAQQPDRLTWVSYTHPTLPYSLRYPNLFNAEEEKAGSVFFRYGCGVPVVVRFHDEKEGRRRGAWFGHESVGDIQLNNRAGKKYIYEHQEGPFSTRTVAYVVAYRGKFLGLEFRTPGELNDVQKRIFDSFTLPAE